MQCGIQDVMRIFVRALHSGLVIAWRVERIILTFRGGDAPTEHEPVAIPPDLMAYIAKFASEWARTDAKKAVLERYDTYRDWNTVRRAFGLGVMD